MTRGAPSKGITHTSDDVQAELCDVIFTAMVALTTLTPDARETFNGHLAPGADYGHPPRPGTRE